MLVGRVSRGKLGQRRPVRGESGLVLAEVQPQRLEVTAPRGFLARTVAHVLPCRRGDGREEHGGDDERHDRLHR